MTLDTGLWIQVYWRSLQETVNWEEVLTTIRLKRSCRETLTSWRVGLQTHEAEQKQCWILHLGWGKPRYLYRLGTQNNSVESILGGSCWQEVECESTVCPDSPKGQWYSGVPHAQRCHWVSGGVVVLCSVLWDPVSSTEYRFECCNVWTTENYQIVSKGDL